ncbi:MAG: LacI family DNA-binding transcriptional regulator [Phocaeicola sp.]
MMKSKVTIADIAAQIGISTATVSRALKNSPSISEGVKEKVWEQAKKMGYGRTPTLEEPKSVVIVVPELFNHFYSEIIRFIEETVVGEYLVSVYCSYNSYEKEKRIIECLSMSEVCCLILSKAMDSPDSNHLREVAAPIIQFNRVDFDLDGPKFLIDNYMDVYAATEKLLKAGYQRVAFAAKHYNCSVYREREQGYRDALAHYNCAFDPKLLIRSELTHEDISKVITLFLDDTSRPDALLLPNYYAALQAVHLAKIRGVKIPDELGIFSLDEEIYSQFSSPTLSTIERPLQRIGEEIGSLVNQIINKKTYEKDQIRIYSSNLILRGSTLPEILSSK